MNKIKISLIIPVYNAEKYLKECIESVQNQTFTDIEIICIDDGSTDSSKEIIKTYGKEDSRIQYFYQENQGPGPARNKGIKEASGEYISFLDSDDLLKKDTLDTTYKLAIEENLDLVLFNGTPIYESKDIEKKHKVYTDYYKRKNTYEEVLLGEELLTKQVNNSDFLPHVGFQLIKKTLIINNDNFFIEALHEDNIFTIKNFLFAERVFHINKEFYIRRLRENSIMTSEMTVRNVHGYFLCIIELLNLTKEKDFKPKTLSTITRLIKGLQQGGTKILINLERNKIEEYIKNLSGEEALLFRLFFDEINKKIKQMKEDKKKIKTLETQVEEDKKKIKTLETQVEEDKKKIKTLEKQIEEDSKIIKKNNTKLKEQNEKISKLEFTITNQNEMILQYKEKTNLLKDQLKTIQSSRTYQIGKIITFIPRKIKSIIKKYSKNNEK
jgi:glycosyltransferase involved in cell wall biosynthesis